MSDQRLLWLFDQMHENCMKPAHTAVMVVLLSLDARGLATLSKAEIGALAGIKERQVNNILSELENDLGRMIKKQRNGGTGKGRAPNSYAIRPDATGKEVPLAWRNEQPATDSNQQPSAGTEMPVAVSNQHAIAGSEISNQQPNAGKELPVAPKTQRPKPPYDNNSTPQEFNPEREVPSGEVAREPSLVDRVCNAVNSPYLDPNKSPGLVTTSAYVERWCGLGLDVETEIVPIIRAKCASLNGHGRAFGTFRYFDGMMLDAVASKKSAQETPDVSARAPDGDPGIRRRQRSKLTERYNRAIADDQPIELGRLDSHAYK